MGADGSIRPSLGLCGLLSVFFIVVCHNSNNSANHCAVPHPKPAKGPKPSSSKGVGGPERGQGSMTETLVRPGDIVGLSCARTAS